MALQIIPPGLLEKNKAKDRIETKEAQAYWKPNSLKDGESEEFRLLGCYETGHAITGFQYASEVRDAKTGELRFNGYVVTRSNPGKPDDIARETDWSKPDRPKIDGTAVRPKEFIAWVATSASRGRLEVLFIEQRGLQEQLSEILQDDEDFTWTDEGLANWSLKITRKGTGLDTTYSLLPKIRKVPEKVVKQWSAEKDSIWLPNFFEGKDPFDGKQTDAKGLPAGGKDANGATVLPKKAKADDDDDAEF